jgi:hypothetical protein
MDENGLPTVHRFITDHDAEGKAIFRKDIKEVLPRQILGKEAIFGLGCRLKRLSEASLMTPSDRCDQQVPSHSERGRRHQDLPAL